VVGIIYLMPSDGPSILVVMQVSSPSFPAFPRFRISGVSGVSGVSGLSGLSGVSGVSGVSGLSRFATFFQVVYDLLGEQPAHRFVSRQIPSFFLRSRQERNPHEVGDEPGQARREVR
jgi:hypothetical protein